MSENEHQPKPDNPFAAPGGAPSGSASAGHYRTTPDDTGKVPGGIPYIVGNEAAERFSFYGMKSILYVFLTEHIVNASGKPEYMDENEANYWVHSFVVAAYFFPIIGAFLSDCLWGKYKTIIWLSIVYCAGHGVMALVDYPTFTIVAPRTTLFAALMLISMGTGGIKPCVSAHVGDQFGPKNKHLLSKVFRWFYFSINVGSAAAFLVIPSLLKHYGPGVAFAVPGIFMAIATIVFWIGRNQYAHIPPARDRVLSDLTSQEGKRAIFNLIPLYLFVAAFWMLFDQTASTWVEQAKHMDREVFGYQFNPSESQATNPIFVLLLIPLFNYVIYPLLGRFVKLTPLRRIGFGLFLAAVSFVIPAYLQRAIDAGFSPHISWQILAYLVLTSAEILVSITTLEFSYTQAPKSLKSIIMGLYLLSVALGNEVTAQVNHYIHSQKENGVAVLDGENYYWFFAGVMLVTAVAFVIFSQFYKGQTYIQGEDQPGELAEAEGTSE